MSSHIHTRWRSGIFVRIWDIFQRGVALEWLDSVLYTIRGAML